MLSQEIKDSLDRKEILLAVFVDFKSVYDSVWRVKLMYKLQKIGVRVRMLKWVHNFITHRFCATKLKVTSQNINRLGEDYPREQSQVPLSLM
jgi:hypothetical protein